LFFVLSYFEILFGLFLELVYILFSEHLAVLAGTQRRHHEGSDGVLPVHPRVDVVHRVLPPLISLLLESASDAHGGGAALPNPPNHVEVLGDVFNHPTRSLFSEIRVALGHFPDTFFINQLLRLQLCFTVVRNIAKHRLVQTLKQHIHLCAGFERFPGDQFGNTVSNTLISLVILILGCVIIGYVIVERFIPGRH